METAENYDRPGGSDGGSGPHSSVIDGMRMMTSPGSKCSSVMELEKGPGLQPEQGQLRAGIRALGLTAYSYVDGSPRVYQMGVQRSVQRFGHAKTVQRGSVECLTTISHDTQDLLSPTEGSFVPK